MDLNTLRYIFATLFGLIMGSFGNVCIYRIPKKESVVLPASHCPKCNAIIHWYDNIPVLSYFLLRAKCRHCKEAISFVYPLIEALSGLLAVAVLWKFGWTIAALLYFFFAWSLLVIVVIDLRYMIIPNVFTFPGLAIGLLGSAFVFDHGFTQSLIGILIGGGLLWAIAYVYFALTKKMGLGGGDVKLMAVVGAFLGVDGVLLTLFLSSLLGAAIGLFLIVVLRKSTKYAMPFGPAIAVGAIIALFFGQELITWYGGLW